MQLSNILIEVDRRTKPNLPDWMDLLTTPKVNIPLQENPSQYKLSDIELWQHDEQKSGGSIMSGGERIYRHLKNSELLTRALDLHDGVEIQKKGAEALRMLCGRHGSLFLWRSVGRDKKMKRNVPYLHTKEETVEIGWRPLHIIQSQIDYSGLFRPIAK